MDNALVRLILFSSYPYNFQCFVADFPNGGHPSSRVSPQESGIIDLQKASWKSLHEQWETG